MKKVLFFICLIAFQTIFSQSRSMRLGIENLSGKQLKLLKKGSIGLICNQTSIDQKGVKTVDILRIKGCNVHCLFAPEHGSEGTVEAGKNIGSKADKKRNVPIISLYGPDAAKNFEDALQSIDTVCFDIQDSGMRYYTYISTLFRAMQRVAQQGKKMVVFDRPNPLGGAMEGPLVHDELRSFISIAPIPLRHGMTVGELARYFNEYILEKKADLTVIPMRNYNRAKPYELNTFLSPNIQNTHACKGYSFLGLLGEVRPFDVCVGSEHAFSCIMLPHTMQTPDNFWQSMQNQLAEYGIATQPFSRFSKRKKQQMVGLKIVDHKPHEMQSFPAFLTTVHATHHAGIHLTFSPSFDKAAGAHWVRANVTKPNGIDTVLAQSRAHLQTFYANAQKVFLYKPYPFIA